MFQIKWKLGVGGCETEIGNYIKAAYNQKQFSNSFPPFFPNLSLPWNDIYNLFIPHREFQIINTNMFILRNS